MSTDLKTTDERTGLLKKNRMNWTKFRYPDKLKNLPAIVRSKAIEIGNILLKDKHMEEDIVVVAAVSKAKAWAAERGLPTEVKEQDENYYVVSFVW